MLEGHCQFRFLSGFNPTFLFEDSEQEGLRGNAYMAVSCKIKGLGLGNGTNWGSTAIPLLD